jgi:membrane protease YdiL (CAAX protease family)
MLNWSLRDIFRWNRTAFVETGLGLFIATAAILLTFCALLVTRQIQIVRVEAHPFSLLRNFLLLTGMAAVEEVLFRVGLFWALLRLSGRGWVAIWGQALLFGLAHAWNPGATAFTVCNNCLGGLLYALALVRTKRIWLPLFLHMAWNYSQAAAGFAISGDPTFSHMLVELVAVGPAAGATDYGLEGSWVSLLARGVVWGLTLRWTPPPSTLID